MKIVHPLAAALVFAGLSVPASAQHHHRPAGIVIENAWARATPPMATTGAAFLTLRNTGKTADRLLSVSTPAAEAAELHTHLHEGNVMRMRKVDAVDIAASATVSFAPGGYHIMLIGLRSPLKRGDTVSLTLSFEKAGMIDVTAPVRRGGPMGKGGGQKGHGSHDEGRDGHRH